MHARRTDYPFSVDVSNNGILVALDSAGLIRRGVRALGVDDVRGHAIPGVYVHKRLAFWQGTLGFEVSVDGAPARSGVHVGVEFVDGVVPQFTQFESGVRVTHRVFAPAADQPAAVVVMLVALENGTTEPRQVTVTPFCSDGNPHSLVPLTPRTNVLTVDGRASAVTRTVDPGQCEELAIEVTFPTAGDVVADAADSLPGVRAAFAATVGALTHGLGRLEVPEDPWMGEILTRACELARQSMLTLPDGTLAGSFWGSNANPLPDVWTRDFGYSALALIESSPQVACAAIDFLARYGLPDRPWEREADLTPDATGLQHSLGNACLAAVLAGLFAERHGEAALVAGTAGLDAYAVALADALLAERPGPGGLYRTLYISDGPSRGDFHIGSNILAWRAAVTLSTRLAARLGADRAEALAELANELAEAISSRGVRRVNGREMFVEGVYSDGQYVRVHDGEESDLTLASVYGFTERDDDRVRAHAAWAHGVGDPYYARATGGVDFWDWDDYNGVTYPGHIHRLSSAGTRPQLASALRAIRETTDLDGSFWWWPFKHGETEPDRVKRGLGKCGWCAGTFVSVLVHDVLGLQRDHDARTLTFAPYTPWTEFRWQGLSFAGGTVDLAAGVGSASVTNNTSGDLTVTLQACLGPDDMIEDIRLNGENNRYQSQVVSAYDAAAVRTTTTVPPGRTATLTVEVSRGPR